ncbi:hypothetical protein [Symbiopectobacterium sp. RP]|uniref:hypothetical protein n=1 Tax=Symbiopectobacterium sp. RP TaxID=3248553 RepID=UPI003D2A9237
MGTSKKQKKRERLRYRDFVLSPYGVIKIKSLGRLAITGATHSSEDFVVLANAAIANAKAGKTDVAKVE